MCHSVGFCWQIVLFVKEVLLLYPIPLNLLVRGNDTQIPNNPKCLHFLLNYFQQRRQHPNPELPILLKEIWPVAMFGTDREKEIKRNLFWDIPIYWKKHMSEQEFPWDLLPRCSSYFKVHSEVFPASSKYPLPISLLSNHNIQSGAPPRLFSDEHLKGITPPTPFSCRVLEEIK